MLSGKYNGYTLYTHNLGGMMQFLYLKYLLKVF
jgi:hypothetical protein